MPTSTTTGDGDVHLHDPEHGLAVSIAPRLGNLAYSLTAHRHELLYFPFESIDDYARDPAGWFGVALLGPWANRLDELAFYANGARYPFAMDLGNVRAAAALHGFLATTSAWEVIDAGADAAAAWLTCRLDVFRRPQWMKQWPFAHTIEMTHRLSAGRLEVVTRVRNHGAEPMPVVLGFHPYFQLTDSPRREWTVSVAAGKRWLLSTELVPTGATEPTAGFFQAGRIPLAGYNLDDVFSDLEGDAAGRTTVSLAGRAQRLDVILGPKYRCLVIYAPHPDGRGRGSAQPLVPRTRRPLERDDFICLEPMVAISNGLNLAHRGLYGELQSVAPGAVWEESFWIAPHGFSAA